MNQEETRRDRGEPVNGAPPEAVEVCEGCGVLAGTPCFPWPCDSYDGPEVACAICTADTMCDTPAEGGGWLCDSCAEWCDGNRAEAVTA